MYEIGEKVIHKKGGLFVIDSMKFIGIGGVTSQFLCLKPYFLTNQNRTTIVYVPVETASSQLRYVMSEDEALKFIEQIKNTEPIWIENAKNRRDEFTKLISTHEKDNICLVTKSLLVQREKLKLEDKSLNLIDYDFLIQVGNEINEELAIALNKPVSEVNTLLLNI